MEDKTPHYLASMVVVVCVAALFMLLFTINGESSSFSITGDVVADANAPPTPAPVASLTDPTPIRGEPTPAARAFTILSVASCLTVALYIYFHPEY